MRESIVIPLTGILFSKRWNGNSFCIFLASAMAQEECFLGICEDIGGSVSSGIKNFK